MKLFRKVTGKVRYFARQNGPTIEIAAGIISFGVAVVYAIKASSSDKVEKTTEEFEEAMESIRHAANDAKEGKITYSKKDEVCDTADAIKNAGAGYFKAYWPVAVSFAAGIILVGHSHRTMKNRYIGATATAAAWKKILDDYRARVVAEEGEEADRKYRFGLNDPKLYSEKEEVDQETGEVKKTVKIDPKKFVYGDPFCRLFGRECYDSEGGINNYWRKDREANMTFLIAQQKYWDKVLKERGWLQFAEVLKALGYKPTRISYEVGWIINDIPEDQGSSFVDFGLYNAADDIFSDDIPLTFNVTRIWEKMPIQDI